MYIIIIDFKLTEKQVNFLLKHGFVFKDGAYQYQTEDADNCREVMHTLRDYFPEVVEPAQIKRRKIDKSDKQSETTMPIDSGASPNANTATAMEDDGINKSSNSVSDTSNPALTASAKDRQSGTTMPMGSTGPNANIATAMKDSDDEDEHADVEDNGDEHRAKPKPDSYIVEDNADKVTFLEDAVKNKKRNATQMSASIYHSISDKSVNNDKVYYIRNQIDHPLSNIKKKKKKSSDKTPEDPLSSRLQTTRQKLFTKKTAAYTVGLNPAFGHQINYKQLDPDKTTKPRTDHEATQRLQDLVDTILNHKNAGVAYIVEESRQSELATVIIDPNQLSAGYPCLIIRLNDLYIPHQDMIKKDTHNEYDDAYTKFLTHLLIACINKELFNNGVGHFIDKRQSFAFMSPTASDVSAAIRLSLGLIPNKKWLDCVINGIQKFDKVLQHLWNNEAIKNAIKGMGTPQNTFKGNMNIYGHKLFLAELLKEDPENSLTDFISKLDENLKKIRKQTETADYFENLVNQLLKQNKVPVDDNFINIFKQIYSLFSTLNESPSDAIDFNKGVTQLMSEYNELLYQYKLKSVAEVGQLTEIPITSESSYDDTDTEILNRSNKYYSPVGMSALSYPLIVLGKILPDKIYYKVEPYAYFELNSIHAMKKRAEKTNKYQNATIVYVDSNPCVNRAYPPISVADTIDKFSEAIKLSEIPQMLVVDITSATQEQIKAIEEKWLASNIPLLCFAKSGLKNMQFGLDMAQYGENRLLINERYQKAIPGISPIRAKLKENCQKVANEFGRATKATSSVYATYVRRQIRSKLQSLKISSDAQIDYSNLTEAEKMIFKFIQTKQAQFELTTGNIIIDTQNLQAADLEMFTSQLSKEIKFEHDPQKKHLKILLTNFSENFSEKLKQWGKPTAGSNDASFAQKPKTMDRSAQLRAANAAGDDRNLHTHGTNPYYWYSIADGLRLLEAIRKDKLDYKKDAYTSYSIKAGGEDHCFNRQNIQGVLLADPYYIDHSVAAIPDFGKAFLSNIETITGGHVGADVNRNHAWDRMPQTLIIPLLTGAHWRCIRVKINYAQKQAYILWDDPYGNFDKSMQTKLLPVLKSGIETLIKKHYKDGNFTLAGDNIFNLVKTLDQQGKGKNGFDCGPITFRNIEDYTDPSVINETFAKSTPENNPYWISAASAQEHVQQMIEIRARDIERYNNITDTNRAGPLDTTRQERVDAIKKSLKQECERLKQAKIPQQIQSLTDSNFAIVLAILDNNRAEDKSIKASQEYTSEEWKEAYNLWQQTQQESIKSAKISMDTTTDQDKSSQSQPSLFKSTEALGKVHNPLQQSQQESEKQAPLSLDTTTNRDKSNQSQPFLFKYTEALGEVHNPLQQAKDPQKIAREVANIIAQEKEKIAQNKQKPGNIAQRSENQTTVENTKPDDATLMQTDDGDADMTPRDPTNHGPGSRR